MNVTTRGLTQAAGLAAATAGAIFIAVQINHPPTDSYLTQTNQWVIRSFAKSLMCGLAIAGITGIYLSQVRQMKALGLVGYLVFAAGYLMMLPTEAMAAALLPGLTHSQPGFVNDVVVTAAGGHPVGNIGHMQVLFNLTGACYMVGGLVFGIALFRAHVLARWAAILLSLSTVATASLAFLPDTFNRPMAVPEGIALIGLGVSLWRQQRGSDRAPTAAAQSTTVRAAPVR
ncbi:MAG TPA: hypothetical protein VGK78_01100 [Nocardioides sp.]|uniref:hypothetical protein n=1 Tax=Nocardioides sp. TaxID=35761 RepID=UPI002F3FDE32